MNSQELKKFFVDNGIAISDPNRPGKMALALSTSQSKFSSKELEPVVIKIDDTNPHIIYPALAGKINIISNLMITNGSPDTAAFVEIRETDASGLLLWGGFASVPGGFANPIIELKQKHVNTPIVAICLTDNSDVWVSANGRTS